MELFILWVWSLLIKHVILTKDGIINDGNTLVYGTRTYIMTLLSTFNIYNLTNYSISLSECAVPISNFKHYRISWSLVVFIYKSVTHNLPLLWTYLRRIYFHLSFVSTPYFYEPNPITYSNEFRVISSFQPYWKVGIFGPLYEGFDLLNSLLFLPMHTDSLHKRCSK